MQVGIIGELWRYPVKSMGGESIPEAHVHAPGMAGDRCWAVLDAETGDICSAKSGRKHRVDRAKIKILGNWPDTTKPPNSLDEPVASHLPHRSACYRPHSGPPALGGLPAGRRRLPILPVKGCLPLPEKVRLNVGYLRLTDSAPLIVARACSSRVRCD